MQRLSSCKKKTTTKTTTKKKKPKYTLMGLSKCTCQNNIHGKPGLLGI